MTKLNLEADELADVAWACAHLRISDCTPDFLQKFIAKRLAERRPALAYRVLGLSRGEMDELCEWLKEQQEG